jgi:hypothetical protein
LNLFHQNNRNQLHQTIPIIKLTPIAVIDKNQSNNPCFTSPLNPSIKIYRLSIEFMNVTFRRLYSFIVVMVTNMLGDGSKTIPFFLRTRRAANTKINPSQYTQTKGSKADNALKKSFNPPK